MEEPSASKSRENLDSADQQNTVAHAAQSTQYELHT